MNKGKKVPQYIVCWRKKDGSNWGFEYVLASTAQNAVDAVRRYCIPDESVITDVAMVIKNWK